MNRTDFNGDIQHKLANWKVQTEKHSTRNEAANQFNRVHNCIATQYLSMSRLNLTAKGFRSFSFNMKYLRFVCVFFGWCTQHSNALHFNRFIWIVAQRLFMLVLYQYLLFYALGQTWIWVDIYSQLECISVHFDQITENDDIWCHSIYILLEIFQFCTQSHRFYNRKTHFFLSMLIEHDSFYSNRARL